MGQYSSPAGAVLPSSISQFISTAALQILVTALEDII